MRSCRRRHALTFGALTFGALLGALIGALIVLLAPVSPASARLLHERLPVERLAVGDAARVEVGGRYGLGICPCFRGLLTVGGLGGRIEMPRFQVRSDGLFEWRQSVRSDFSARPLSELTAGRFQLLWLDKRVGIEFPGLTWGTDLDRSYDERLATGVSLVLTILDERSYDFRFYTGYGYEAMRINLRPDRFSRHLLPQRLVFRVSLSDELYGEVSTLVAPNVVEFRGSTARYGGAALLAWRALRFGPGGLVVGLRGQTSYDPFRRRHGLWDDEILAGIFVRVELSGLEYRW